MSKRIILILACTINLMAAQAYEVSQDRAKSVATALMAQRVEGFNQPVASIKTISYEGQKVYHIVQFFGGGWMIISADDFSAPLIGYSPDGVYQSENTPENERGMMELYCQQVIRNARLLSVSQHSDWTQQQTGARSVTRGENGKVAPLIKVNWNQSGSYKKYCPQDSKGQAIVGCVAVAMAQAMSVVQWPKRPVGYYTYNSSNYGSLYIDYDKEGDYNWENILTGANGNDDVARLLWHCGVSVNMDYGIDGSGTQTSYIASALRRNFQYPKSVAYYSRSNFNRDDWHNLILTEVQEGRAVAYNGIDSKKKYGHCFNLDGYDGTFFHVNWGWGGSNNGYFGLDGLRDATMDMDYTDGQGAVIGIRAPSEKPSDIIYTSTTYSANGNVLPSGTVVGNIEVESEATNPTYTFTIKGAYSVILHTYLTVPLKVEDGCLVTTEDINVEDYPEGMEIQITAKNNENGGEITRHFIIAMSGTSDIVNLNNNSSNVVSKHIYTLSGLRVNKDYRGLTIIKRTTTEGKVESIKVLNR